MSIGNNKRKILRRITHPVESVKDLVERYLNLLIDDLNIALRTLSLSSNFDSQLIERVEIPANSTKRVYHRLETIPAFRLVLRQSSGGTILDGEFSSTYVDLTNTGASTAILSVLLLKE